VFRVGGGPLGVLGDGDEGDPDSMTKRSTTTARNATTGTINVDRMSAMPPPRFHPSDPMPEMRPQRNVAMKAMPIATSPTR
jgi:hypothetical protein